MDHETEQLLNGMNLIGVTLVPVKAIEDALILSIKQHRQINEYCWTLKPVFLLYLLNSFKNEIQRVTYIDADGCFFADPNVIFDTQENCSVLLSKHNYSSHLKYVEKDAGKYNSGFISILNDDNGMNMLKWWRDQCFNWCFDRAENGKFGDQKYLETMPLLFNKVCDITTPGVNIGPWNDLYSMPRVLDGKVYLNNDSLIFYHFAGLRIISENELVYILGFNKSLKEHVYDPYMSVLKKVFDDIRKIDSDFYGFYDRNDLRGKRHHKLVN
jgi:hypothetical protein